jgi:hypothetical protein
MEPEKNGTTKISAYQSLSELDAHFTGIIETLTVMAAKSPDAIKTELGERVVTAKLLRHQVVSLIAGRLAEFEAKQVAKLTGK